MTHHEPGDGRSGERRVELVPGKAVGTWTVERRIGAGGFGAVYAARSSDGGERVAIKVLHDDLVRSQDMVSRFEREVEVIQMIAHPAVVSVSEVGQLPDGRPYYVMEYLEGEDLSTHLRKTGRMSGSQAFDVLEPVCSALEAAHARGVVHRDVKASNVFLCDDGRVLLLDFGIAKLADDAGPGLTTSWQVLGTPAYRAPEQVGRIADARSDVYSVGALAYTMLTGRAPFAGDSASLVQRLHRHARRPRPSLRANVPVSFDPVVVKAMSTEPEHRFASAAEFLDAFRRALARADGPGEGTAELAVGLAVHVCASVRPGQAAEGATGAGGNPVLDELERLLAAAERWLGQEGFESVVVGSQSLVAARVAPADSAALDEVRIRAERVAEDLREASSRGSVALDVTVHADSVCTSEGEIVGGALFDLGCWPSTLPSDTAADAAPAARPTTTETT